MRDFARFYPEYVEQARQLSKLGCTDFELSEFWQVSLRDIASWRLHYPEFAAAIKLGTEVATDNVERAMYASAVGYTYKAERPFKDPRTGEIEIVTYTAQKPPDIKAGIFWLINKRGEDWKDSKIIERKNSNKTREQLFDELTKLHARTARSDVGSGNIAALTVDSADKSKH